MGVGLDFFEKLIAGVGIIVTEGGGKNNGRRSQDEQREFKCESASIRDERYTGHKKLRRRGWIG